MDNTRSIGPGRILVVERDLAVARFAQFVRSPDTVIAYLRAIKHGSEQNVCAPRCVDFPLRETGGL